MTSQAYQEALINAAKTMVRVRNPRRLLKMITRFVVKEVGLTHTSILIQEPAKNRYVFVDSKGNHRIPTSLFRLDQGNPLIQWFLRKDRKSEWGKGYVSYADLLKQSTSESIGTERERARLHKLKDAMNVLRASVCVPGFYKGELLGILILGEKLDHTQFTPDEIAFFQALANDASIAIKAANLREDLLERNLDLELKQKELKEKIHVIERLRQKEQSTYHQIILSLAREVHEKDPYTSDHLDYVQKLGFMTAKELGYNLIDQRKRNILKAALCLHDVGKIGIPDSILKKMGPLTENEWKIMKQHPARGSKILEPLSEFKEAGEIIMHHHENYDGSGYPDGLKGDEIPIESRIVAVVDAFHAIVSTRCYRRGRSVETAMRELERGAGSQFDPMVVAGFIRAFRKEEGIKFGKARRPKRSVKPRKSKKERIG